ncbi:MAG: type II toxin-antitoxin system RelE/ParE family toxin [Prevotella sp.]
MKSLPSKAKEKVMYNIGKSMYSINNELFKKLGGSEIWEFRTLHNGMCYRLFSFWDSDIETLVVATHGIVKKTKKTPVSEIEKADNIRKEYFKNKKQYG